jgi:hypothetical protein
MTFGVAVLTCIHSLSRLEYEELSAALKDMNNVFYGGPARHARSPEAGPPVGRRSR